MNVSTSAAMVHIIVNGEPARIGSGQSLTDWLASLDRDPRSVAIEINGSIAPRDTYGSTILHDGDRLEVVHFVQGG